MRLFNNPGRSLVHSTNAMVATSQPLASSVAIDILRRGGNAMDAAISAAALLGVIEPTDTGIGGDCFVLYHQEGKAKPIAFNGSGKSPKALTREHLISLGIYKVNNQSPHSVTIPGAVDAWWKLHKCFCKLDFEELLKPAIYYAENGYVVHERLSRTWKAFSHRLLKNGEARDIFLIDNNPPSSGQKMTNKNLAETLKMIAKKGSDGFYKGETANKIVKCLNKLGGVHSLDDFSEVNGEFVEPINAEYKNNTVFQLPPNTQGIIALIILKIIEHLNINDYEYNSAERTHLLIEASKIAYSCRENLLGDLDSSSTIMKILNNKNIIKNFSKSIKKEKSCHSLPPIPSIGSNTVYLTIVDKDQNIVSFINSIYESFGSGIVPNNTGVILQNRGSSFNLDKNHPNCIGPLKKPMHTIIPGMVYNEGRPILSYGVMGGDYQPIGHAHVLSNIIDHGLNIQEALDAPRFMPYDTYVDVETGINPSCIDKLGLLGHDIRFSKHPLGGGQGISINTSKGILSGGSDPRKDGLAIGY